MKTKVRFSILFTALISSATAHDTWLVASKNAAAVNEPVHLALATGEVFPISEVTARPERVAEFVTVQGPVSERIEGYAVDGKDLVATISFDEPGAHIVGIALHPNFIELQPSDFKKYLEEEEAHLALERWKGREKTSEPARELYTKYAKTLIEVSFPPAKEEISKPVGHTLEIVALNQPGTWRVGSVQRFQVLFEGKPAATVRLSAGHEGLAAHTFVEHVTTNANGEAAFKLTRPGLWFVRTHLVRPLPQPRAAPTDPQGRKAEWESFWASLTFRVPE